MTIDQRLRALEKRLEVITAPRDYSLAQLLRAVDGEPLGPPEGAVIVPGVPTLTELIAAAGKR
jgi:hypothetical protein